MATTTAPKKAKVGAGIVGFTAMCQLVCAAWVHSSMDPSEATGFLAGVLTMAGATTGIVALVMWRAK